MPARLEQRAMPSILGKGKQGVDFAVLVGSRFSPGRGLSPGILTEDIAITMLLLLALKSHLPETCQ